MVKMLPMPNVDMLILRWLQRKRQESGVLFYLQDKQGVQGGYIQWSSLMKMHLFLLFLGISIQN